MFDFDFDFIDKNMLRIKLNSWLCCLFLAGILSAIATFVIKYPAVTQELDAITSPTKLTEKPESDPLVEQLIGRWEVELPNGISSVFIFAPDGEFFDLSKPDTAIRFYWVIDRTQPQPQVFVNFGIGILKANLSDSEEMQMRVLPLAPIPNVNSEAIEKFVLPARKLSSDYSLPVGRDLVEAEEHYRQRANLAKQSEAKQYISSINMFQKANFWKHQKFIPNIEEIAEKIGIKFQTSNYHYHIFLSQDDRVANVLAIPKGDNLRGYFGRVATKSNNTEVTPVAIECESIKPTNNPPLLPLPTVVEGNLQCPTDYELLGFQQRAGFSRQAEARHYMTWINLVQQSQFRRHQKFIPDIQTITQELGIKSQTSNYNYQVFLSQDDTVANVVAIPRDENLRAYVGRVTTESNTTGVTTVAIRCASLKLTNNSPSLPNVVGANLQCPTDYELLKLNQQQSDLARQSEAKDYVNALNRGQQDHFQRHQKFIPDVQQISKKVAIKSQTSNYNYQVFLSQDGSVANVVAIPKRDSLKIYVGRVTSQSNTTGVNTVAILCESIKLTNNLPSLPNVVGANLQCPSDYKSLNLQGSSPVSLPVEPAVPQPSFSPLPSLPRLPKALRLPTLAPIPLPQPSFSPLPTVPPIPEAPRLPTLPPPPSPVPSPSSSSDRR